MAEGVPDAFKRYKRKKGGPDATLIDVNLGGDIIILTEGPNASAKDNYAEMRGWIKTEVTEYRDMMTLEYIMDIKRRVNDGV